MKSEPKPIQSNPQNDPTQDNRAASSKSINDTVDLHSDKGSSAGSFDFDLQATSDFDPQATTDHVVGSKQASSTSIRIPGYEILCELGHGGMGIVFKAVQLQADRQVALKVMLNAAGARPDEIARFHKEVQAAAKLVHPNIVQVYEVHTEGAYPYFTQEYVPGGNLAERIKDKLLPHSETASSMLQISRAIAFARTHGVVHRDLKPANILVGTDGSLKIADFGLARRIDDESKLTKDGTVLGTPSYMAPEQASGSRHLIGPLSDVYSLGAILYELLTGRPPFKGASVWEVINLVRNSEPAPPSGLRPDTPRDLETICIKCLQKSPDKRYASASDLADDLQRFIRNEPILARPTGHAERFIRLCKRHPVESGLLGVLFTILLVVAIGSSWAALTMQRQRNQIAQEKQVAEKRLGLYRDNVSSMVNYFPQMLEDLPLAQPLRSRLNELTEELLNQQEDASALVGPSQQWGMVGVAIGKGNLYLVQIEQTEADPEILQKAAGEFQRAQKTCREIVDQRQGDQAKALSNLALCLSRQAAVERIRDRLTDSLQLYTQAIEYRQQATNIPRAETEKSEVQLQADLGREYSNLAGIQAVLSRQSPDQSSQWRHAASSTLDLAINYLRQATFQDDGTLRAEAKANALRDLAISHELAAEIAADEGLLPQAAEHYATATNMMEQALKIEPERHSLKTQLARSAFAAGDFCLVQNHDAASARGQYVKGMRELLALVTSNDWNNLMETGLAMGYYRLGLAAIGQANPAKAQKYFERCVLIRELNYRQSSDLEVAKVDPLIFVRQKLDLLLAQAWAGQSTHASQEARGLIEVARKLDSEPEALSRAKILAFCAAILGICSQHEDEATKLQLVDEAIQALEMAKKLGYQDVQFLATDPDFWPLQSQPQFAKFLAAF